MIYAFLLGCFLLAVVMGMIVIPKILFISYKKNLFDLPDERKVHSVPVPRLGGLSFFPVILISVGFILGLRYHLGFSDGSLLAGGGGILCQLLFLTVGCMLLYLIGVADDLVGVSYRYKFVAQIIAALLFVSSDCWFNTLGGLFGIYELPAWIGMPFTVIAVVYITNAINLIDGIDGLASGLSSIALAVFSVMCILSGWYIYALLSLATLGVLVPFWFYNVFGNAKRGHKLFMGDTGSLMLGYIISFLVINLCRVEPERITDVNPNIIISFSVIIVPLLDVVRVVLHRVRKGRNPFLPDKNHFHHKLLRTGMRSPLVLVTILFVAVFFIVFNQLLASRINITLLLVIDVALWTLMHLYINKKIYKHEGGNPCSYVKK